MQLTWVRGSTRAQLQLVMTVGVRLIDNSSAPPKSSKFATEILRRGSATRTPSAIMAPPAVKRRKLEHSDSENESERSFAGFDETNDASSGRSDAEDAADSSDVSMNGLDALDDDDDVGDDAEEDFEEDETVHESRKQTPAGKATTAQKPAKRPVQSLQDGVYTSESFKSNMFKLQMDELLGQVKLKYGKKEAPAENAMRTLKNIIDQIPSRDALPVCRPCQFWEPILTMSRLSQLRRHSNLPALRFPSQNPAHRKTPYTSCSMSGLRA